MVPPATLALEVGAANPVWVPAMVTSEPTVAFATLKPKMPFPARQVGHVQPADDGVVSQGHRGGQHRAGAVEGRTGDRARRREGPHEVVEVAARHDTLAHEPLAAVEGDAGGRGTGPEDEDFVVGGVDGVSAGERVERMRQRARSLQLQLRSCRRTRPPGRSR